MKQSLILLSIALLPAACRQPNAVVRPGSRWFNGYALLTADSVSSDYIRFDGKSQREDTDRILVTVKDNGAMTVLEGSTYVDASKKLSLLTFGRDAVLVIRGRNGTLEDVFERLPADIALSDAIEADAMRFGLAGGYVDEATGRPVVFASDARRVTGLPMGSAYTFEADGNGGGSIITIGGDSSYFFAVTDSGLELYRAQKSDGELSTWVTGEKAYSLRKTEWPDLAPESKLQGRYTFASTQPLGFDILALYSTRQRRLMRNEIFARYGYRFKDPELRSYFVAQPWYIPSADDVTAKLTPLEKFNVEVLGRYGH